MLTARGRDLTGSVQVRVDPQARTTAEALQARFAASQRVAELARAFADGALAMEAAANEVETVQKGLTGRDGVSPAIRSRVDDVAKKIEKMKTQFKSGFGGPRFKYLDLAGQLQASTAAPTEAQMTAITQLSTELTDNIEAVNTLIATDLPEVENTLRGSQLNPFNVKPVKPPNPPR